MTLEGNTPIGHKAFLTSVTGMARIPGLVTSAVAALAVGELAHRCLSLFVRTVFRYNGDGANFIWKNRLWNFRPFEEHKNDKKETVNNWKSVASTAVSAVVVGILYNDFITYTMGKTPAIYNRTLKWLGPIRIDSNPYITEKTPYIGPFASNLISTVKNKIS